MIIEGSINSMYFTGVCDCMYFTEPLCFERLQKSKARHCMCFHFRNAMRGVLM